MNSCSCSPLCFVAARRGFSRSERLSSSGKKRPAREAEQEQRWIESLENRVRTEDEVLAELMAEHIALEKVLGGLTGSSVPHDVRDRAVVDFARARCRN